MGEREERIRQDYERQNVPLNPFDKMYNFVRERTQGFDQLEIGNFQRFGQINVRINQLDEQVRENKGSVDYFLSTGSPWELNSFRVNLIKARRWVDLLGRIASRLDRAYFITSDMQAVSEEITAFARGRE